MGFTSTRTANRGPAAATASRSRGISSTGGPPATDTLTKASARKLCPPASMVLLSRNT
ncbi:MAG: hypothetical protein LBO82_05735 [Synergistaceae bacterium]|nr:hypothetical protein [Synergistaceae bacterium]